MALLTALASSSGCRFGALSRNLRVLDENGYVRGTALSSSDQPIGQLVVFAVPVGGTSGTAADWAVLARPGPYFLVVPVGEYRLGAYEDRNRSLTHDVGEPAIWARDGEPIIVRSSRTTGGLNLVPRADQAATPIAVALPVRGATEVDELPASRIGEVTSIDDPRFSDASAQLGLWQPVDFLVNVGAGIYFLEPYDPARTPVLFVHGVLGHPGNFRALVAKLDRSRFQPWFAFYPSAVRLEVAGAALDRWLQALEVEYGFPRIGVVAHSMGGLVARAYLADDTNGLGGMLERLTFVSIATPWRGHAAASLGVARAPVVVPSWFDMAPESPFLAGLLSVPLPPYATHDLYFAYGGSRRIRGGGGSNDGVVTLSSQLDLRAQQHARRVIGFDAQHAAVLNMPEVADELHRSLADVAPPG